MNEKKTAIILANGFEEIEALTVVDILRRAGVKCDMVALANDATNVDANDAMADNFHLANNAGDNNPTNSQLSTLQVFGAHNISVVADQAFTQTDWNTYDMLILPGGLPGADTLRDDPRVISLVQSFANNPEKHLAAICAAPQVLAKADVVRGMKVTSYPSEAYQNALESAGAEYVNGPTTVTDKNLITSRGPATASDFAFKILEALNLDPTPTKSDMLFA